MSSAKAVVIDDCVYVGGGLAYDNATRRLVFRYAPLQDEWTTLPPSPVKSFGVGQLSGKVVLVGGELISTNKSTQSVHVFENECQQWVTSIPPMPTARSAPTVVSHSSTIIACGGYGEGSVILATVEVYRSETHQWYTVDPLPSPRDWSSCVTIGDTCFMIGGFETLFLHSAKRSVISASVTTILERARSQSDPHGSHGSAITWKSLPDTHNYTSTAATISGCLLAVGGFAQVSPSEFSNLQASLHAYCPGSSSWIPVGDLPSPCARCTAVLLPSNELLIIGGKNNDKIISSVVRGKIQI